MAYLCKQEFGKRNKAGAGMRFETRVFVVSSGEFVFYDIPPDVLRMLEAAKAKLRLHRDGIRLGLRVEKMEEGRRAIEAAMDALLTETVTDELVLRYNYTATCPYYVAGDGSLHANGVGDEEREGKWIDTVIDGEPDGGSWHSRDAWLLGFSADVEKKITYTCGKKVRIAYANPEESELGEWGNKLNTFVHVNMRGTPKELPYTEDVAKKFYESMWMLCKLARGLTEFLSEPKNILSGKLLLLGSTKTRKKKH